LSGVVISVIGNAAYQDVERRVGPIALLSAFVNSAWFMTFIVAGFVGWSVGTCVFLQTALIVSAALSISRLLP
jgi:hypothetical protein